MDRNLFDACQNGDRYLVNSLIVLGATDWNLGLEGACIGGHIDLVQLMISKGSYFWATGLVRACISGHLEIAKLMLSKGALVNNYDFYNACSAGHIEIVKLLFHVLFDKADKAGKGVNNCNLDYALLRSRKGKQLNVTKFLIPKGGTTNFYLWPDEQTETRQLLYLKVPLNAFSKIKNYHNIEMLVVQTKKSILKSDVMIPDLLLTVSQCIII